MWTDERTQKLAKLWRDGFSAAEIATKMGGGLSRNAIIGRAYRLGLSRSGDVPMVTKPRSARKPRKARSEPRTKPTPRTEPIVPATVQRPKLTTDQSASVARAVLTLAAGQCRFPLGHLQDADFHFCGSPQREGASYCEAHMRLTHLPRETTAAADRRAEKQARSAA